MTNKTEKPARKKRPLLTVLGVLIVLVCVLLIAAIVFPTPILRYVFSRVEAQTGIALTFDKAYFYIAEGSFLSLDGLTVKRQNHPAVNFDLRAENVRMPAMVPRDFYSPILLVSGVRGTIERVGSEDDADNKEKAGNGSNGGGDINLQALLLVDAEVEFIDRTPEKPFWTTIQIDEFSATNTNSFSLFSPYTCSGFGQISVARFGISAAEPGKMEVSGMPLGLFAPYAPVLDDIFDSGSMYIHIEDLTDATQKKMRITVILLQDCKLKSADQLLAPAIQAALQQLDQSSLPSLPELQGRIERLRISAESIRAEIDKITPIIDSLKMLAPRDVREKYEKFKSQYDRAKMDYDEWNTKFATLLRDLDRVKIGIVEDTFQHFINSAVPIEIELQEVNGEWHYDSYETVVRLVEANYRTIIEGEFEKRILEIRNAVNRLLN